MYMGSLTLLRLYTALQLMLLLTPPILNGLRAEPTLQFDVERQISKFYNLTSIKSYSLNDLNWTLISWKTMEDVVIIRGEWEAGTFEGYTSDSRLKNITLHMAAIAFLPVETEAQVGLICALHTEDHMLSVDHSIYIRLCREYGIPILLYGEKAEDWESMGYTGRNDLIHIGYYAAYLLNKDSAWNVLTGNFALALARTQSYAITLLQRICGKIGVKIDMVGFYGGSKEGYAQWFASTMDDRILISSPVGFQMENLTACIEYMFKQWGNYNPYLPEGKPQPIDLAPIYNFLTTTPQGRVVEQALSIARRMDKLKAEIYIIGGDVCGYNMHDGRNYPLGCETEFLESLKCEWRYVMAVNNSEKEFLNDNRLEAMVQLTLNPKLVETWPKIESTSIEEREGSVRVKAYISGNVTEAYLMYGLSKDKVWNSPNVRWTSVRLEKIGEEQWVSPWIHPPEDTEMVYFVRAVQSGDPARIDSSPVKFYNELPDKRCSWNPRCVPGLPCIDSSLEPGEIINIEYISTEPPVKGGRYGVAVFYVDFWSTAHRGSRIGARLYIPVGRAEYSMGWPLKIFMHGFGGPGYDYWYYPFTDNWKSRGNDVGMTFASYGFVCLNPWVSGAGPSEPFQKYSPLTTWENCKVCFDSFKALQNIPEYMRKEGLDREYGLDLEFDYERIVFSTHCVSSALLIEFAHQYTIEKHPETEGLRVLVADSFLPSVAYTIRYILPFIFNTTGERAFLSLVLWAGPIWCLAEDQGWDKSTFFTHQAIKAFSAPTQTPAGIMSLMRASQLEPLSKSMAGIKTWPYFRKIFGSEATGQQMATEIFTSPILELASKHESFEEILSDPFYRKYFARSDPFFEENIEPFSPDIPLYVAVTGVESDSITPPGYRAENICLPKIETLKDWGWMVHYKYNPDKDICTWEGEGLKWILENLEKELYGSRVKTASAPWTILLFVAVLTLAAILLAALLRKLRREESTHKPPHIFIDCWNIQI
ncbi:MAG TPA: hypothetical protein ENF42_00670 [Candidatus Bathyarchaeota archaeon]|nr:hypothetical protein [Candidatus Bathyarchaeota archaeon]